MSHNEYLERMRLISLLTQDAARQAIEALGLEPGTRGLDLGCGAGDKSILLARAVGPRGSVSGLDISEQHLAAARESAAELGLSDRLLFERGDLHSLPFPDHSFDWAWSMDTLWPVPGIDPLAGVAELRRVVRPGGRVGLLFWSGQSLLPGYPRLEALLGIEHIEHNPYLARVSAPRHFLRALGWLCQAGLEQPTAVVCATQHQAPLNSDKRRALLECLDMLWGECADKLPDHERELYARLSDPQSGECILDSPDYHCSIIYTLFQATAPAGS